MLTLTMGIPAAGKTTAAQARARLTGAHLITTDRIRTDRTIRRDAWLRHLEATVTAHIRQGHDVIVDACSVQADQRAHWRHYATRHGVPAHLLVVRVPLHVAMARNARRTHPVPDHVMHHYAALMRQAAHDVITERWELVEVLSARRAPM